MSSVARYVGQVPPLPTAAGDFGMRAEYSASVRFLTCTAENEAGADIFLKLNYASGASAGTSLADEKAD